MTWCCIEPERVEKTERLARALAAGCGGKVVRGAPPDDGEFIVWGHLWLSERIVPRAHAEGRPWWLIDNGYHMPARGQAEGYYSLTYRGTAPVFLDRPDMARLRVDMEPWRARRDGYVLLAAPGEGFGRMLGLDLSGWASQARDEIRAHTDRRIVVRDKRTGRKLDADLAGAAVVVTHSSKVAVDAVRAGIPAIVAPTNPAAPVCSTDMADIENPPMPDRERWFASLMCQQFTIAEMRDGTAKFWMAAIKEKADGLGQVQERLLMEADLADDDHVQGGRQVSGEGRNRVGGDRQGCGGEDREKVEAFRAG